MPTALPSFPKLGSALVLLLVPVSGQAQDLQPRSRDYLMLAAVDDVRASWVNPGGLARVLEASIMGELVVDRLLDGTLHVGQYTLGLNSRGLSLSFLRDRIPDSVSVTIWRLAFAVPFRRWSVGAAISQYRSFGQDEGVDIGARFTALPQLDLGLVTRNLSRPFVRGTRLPITTAAGAAWSQSVVTLAAEVEAIERPGAASGFDRRYRGVLGIEPHDMGIGLVVAVDLDNDATVGRWTLGFHIGGADRAGILGSGSPDDGLGRLDRMSVVGVASRRGQAFGR